MGLRNMLEKLEKDISWSFENFFILFECAELHKETGYGGTTQKGHDKSKVGKMKAKKDRVLTVKFNADIAATMR